MLKKYRKLILPLALLVAGTYIVIGMASAPAKTGIGSAANGPTIGTEATQDDSSIGSVAKISSGYSIL